MEELEDDPSSEMLAIELYRPAVFAARPFKFKLYYRLKALRPGLLRLNREPRGLRLMSTFLTVD